MFLVPASPAHTPGAVAIGVYVDSGGPAKVGDCGGDYKRNVRQLRKKCEACMERVHRDIVRVPRRPGRSC